MKLLMISGDRSVLQGKMGAFWYTLQELRKHWDRIDVICPRVPESGAGLSESGHRVEIAKTGGGIYFHPCPGSLLFQPRWIATCGERLLKKYEHDVMTVHEFPPFYNGVGACLLRRKTRIPCAMEVHHVVGYPQAASVSELIGRLMSRVILPLRARCTDGTRVVNAQTAALLQKWGVPEDKIQILSSFYLDKDILHTRHKPPVIYDVAFCGRLVPNKGLSEALDALALLKGVRMVVIGDGPERKPMEKKAKVDLKLGNRVTFLGWLPTQEAVSGALQSARLFLMNSRSEGGPRIALEAMACGLPVIATRVGVMPEVIEDGKNGVFTTGEPEDVADKIRDLLDDEKKADALGKAASGILERFERQTLVKAYADFLKNLSR